MIDVAQWLSPLDGASPSGEDLRNDPRFHDLERLIEPTKTVSRDEQNRASKEITVPVEWELVLEKAEELRLSGRDLRLMTIVVRALANTDSLMGLAQGLSLIAQSLETYWDSLHPMLRGGGQPREAALRRINALLDLQNAQEGLLNDLRAKIFFAPRGIGPVTGEELEQGSIDDRTMLLEAASGLNAKEQAALTEKHNALIARVRTGCTAQGEQAAGDFAALKEGASASRAALEALDTALNSKIGGFGPTVPDLKKFLDRVAATLDRAPGAQANAAPAAIEEASTQPVANGHAPTAFAPASAGLPGRLTSRDEVVKCLDLVVDFYDRTEPSSPIPHLARRVRRMVHMDFMQLMEEMAPSGLKEFRTLAGVPESKKAS